MARVASKSDTPNNPVPPRKQRPIAERQESAKGDMFFKVVISMIIIGIIAVLLWFLIDSLIPRPEEEGDRFVWNQFVIVDEIRRIHDAIENPAGVAGILNNELIDAFEQREISSAIYVFVVNPLWAEMFEEGTPVYNRYQAMWDNYYALFDLGYVGLAGTPREGFIYFDNIAVFILNVNATGNEDWLVFANEIKDENLPPIHPGPVIIRIDISDASPSFSLIFNDDVNGAIEDAIYFVNYGEYPSDEDEEE